MGYYVDCNGTEYGILPNRPWYISFILNIPIINLLYSKKIRIILTKVRGSVSKMQCVPVLGLHGDLRIFRWQQKVNYRYKMPGCGCMYTIVYVKTIDESKFYLIINEKDRTRSSFEEFSGEFEPGKEYVRSIIISRKAERRG